MISVDGERSRQRLHKALDMMETCRMLGLPAKSLVMDGFSFRVNAMMEEIDLGRVTAPDGAMVAKSTPQGVKVASADWWLSWFNGAVDARVDQAYAAGNEFVFRAAGTAGGFSTDVLDPTTVEAPTPSLLPIINEVYALGLSTTDTVSAAAQSCLSALAGLYGTAGGDNSIGMSGRAAYPGAMPQCLIPFASDEGASQFAAWRGKYGRTDDSTVWNFAYQFVLTDGALGVAVYPMTAFVAGLPGNVPQYLGQEVLGVSPPIPEATAGFMHDHGGHALTLHLLSARNTVFAGETPEGGGDAYLEYRAIMVLYSWGVGGWRYTLTQLRAVCDLFFGAASRTVQQVIDDLRKLFGWPCTPFKVGGVPVAALDTVMLPLADTNLAVWTRAYGTALFSLGGGVTKFSPGTFVVPALASGTAGVRPSMSHAGGGVYFCACEDTGNDRLVLGLYVGSPLTATWAALPMPAKALLHARPIEVTAESVIVLGLVGELEAVDGVNHVTACNLAVLRDGAWQDLAPLPFAPGPARDARWSCALFGNEALAGKMMRYPQPPPAICGVIET